MHSGIIDKAGFDEISVRVSGRALQMFEKKNLPLWKITKYITNKQFCASTGQLKIRSNGKRRKRN